MRVLLQTDLTALTPEQTSALGPHRDRWTAIRRATLPADRSAAEAGVRLAYQAAGFEPPQRIVWCRGPIELADQASQLLPADGANLKSIVIDSVRSRVASAVRRRVHRKVRTTVANALNIADALSAAGAEAVARSARHELLPLLISIRRALSRLLAGNLVSAFSLRHGAVGQRDLAWLGVYEYFHNVCDLRAETEPLRGLWLIAKNAGWMLPHEHVCWLVERPNILRSDAKDRLHSAKGPALQYPDGWSLYAWKGVTVPARVIEQPEQITLEAIDGETDIQIRRCMIEIMTPERFVAKGGAARVAGDETGILWRKVWTFDAWTAVEVINGTAEPDGMRKHFFLQVPPQMRTPRQAVAWTYGLSEEQYTHLTLRT